MRSAAIWLFLGKGGSGKSTLAVRASESLIERKSNVVIVDADGSNLSVGKRLRDSEKLRKFGEEGVRLKLLELDINRIGAAEILKKSAMVAGRINSGAILIDLPAGISREVEILISKADGIFQVISTLGTEIREGEEFLKTLSNIGALEKTVIVFNKMPIRVRGFKNGKVEINPKCEDEKTGMLLCEKIEEIYGKVARGIMVIPNSQEFKKVAIGNISDELADYILNSRKTEGALEGYPYIRERVGRRIFIHSLGKVAAAFAISTSIPTGISEERFLETNSAYLQGLLSLAEGESRKYFLAFLQNNEIEVKAEYGDSIEGIALWAFEKYSGFLELREGNAMHYWEEYKRDFISRNGYRDSLDIGDVLFIPPYRGKRHPNYEKRLLMMCLMDKMLRKSKVVSGYLRVRSYGGSLGGHPGIDLNAPYGTIVRAYKSGWVVKSSFSRSYGYNVLIRDANNKNLYYRYAHLSRRGRPRKGRLVKRWQRIGYMGSSGRSSAPHLHFEVLVKTDDGSLIDINPFEEISREAENIAERYLVSERSKY